MYLLGFFITSLPFCEEVTSQTLPNIFNKLPMKFMKKNTRRGCGLPLHMLQPLASKIHQLSSDKEEYYSLMEM
jgi:hypothetical protein